MKGIATGMGMPTVRKPQDVSIGSAYAASVNYALAITLVAVVTFAFAQVAGGVMVRDLFGCVNQSIAEAGSEPLVTQHVCP